MRQQLLGQLTSALPRYHQLAATLDRGIFVDECRRGANGHHLKFDRLLRLEGNRQLPRCPCNFIDKRIGPTKPLQKFAFNHGSTFISMRCLAYRYDAETIVLITGVLSNIQLQIAQHRRNDLSRGASG